MTDDHSHAAVDYESVSDRSMWGSDDAATRKAIEGIVSGGKW